MTAATPIRIPSMVKIDLSLLPSKARIAVEKQSQSFISLSPFEI
jgi:hypothetical protein